MKSSSFRMRLLVAVVLPVSTVLLVAMVHDIAGLKFLYRKMLYDQADTVTSLVGDAIVLPLWDFNIPQVKHMVEGLLKDGTIGDAVLLGQNGSVLTQSSLPTYVPNSADIVFKRDLIFEINGTQEYLGQLIVQLPTDALDAEINEAVLQKILSASIIILTILAFLHVLLTRLAQPISAMAKTVEKIKDGTLDITIPAMARTDEIGKLARALDLLRQNEGEVRELRKLNDVQNRQKTKRIRFALESTDDAVLLVNESNHVAFCNPRIQKFFGEVTVGSNLDACHFSSLPSLNVAISAIKAKDRFEIDTNLVNPNDDELNLSIRGGPIYDEDKSFLGTILIATDNTEQVRQAERARFNADHDSLTNLPNRRFMERTLDHWSDEQTEISILLGDLDHFKLINDNLGHPVGDQLLRRIADIFCKVIHTDDIAVRLGGDEFAILAKGKEGCNRLSEYGKTILLELDSAQFLNGIEVHTGLSAGIAAALPTEVDMTDVLRRADLALYEAKRLGRGRVEIFHEKLELEIKRKGLIEAELRSALMSNDIFPVFQMQTSLQTNKVDGYEALARWEHPELGPISPGEFIPIAEESGLIRELTHQMLMQSCRAASEWRALGFRGRIAVNISPKLFGSGVAEFINDCLFATGCPADAIEVEITETVVLANGTSARHEIEAMQALGLTIALDDFGMGYSSLSYLQKFPVDKIKIDRAFVSKMPTSQETKAIVIAIIQLGHALGMTVTGEGAETEVHRSELRKCHADTLQGFVDGQPMKKHEVDEMMKSFSAKKIAI